MSVYVTNQLRNILRNEGYPLDMLYEGYGRQDDVSISVDVEKGLVVVEDDRTKKITAGKPAATLRRLLFPMVTEVLPDVMFENIANKIKAIATLSKGHIEIWDADRIPEAYHMQNYADPDEVDTGSLAASCMRYEECQDRMTWYKELGEGLVQIAVLVRENDSKILGRALVWNLPNGRIFMDRAYGSDATREMFKNYAMEQGWWKRTRDSYEESDKWTSPDGTKMRGVEVEIPIPRSMRMIQNVPYVDTMCVINAEDGVLTNVSHDDQWSFYLQTLSGTPDYNVVQIERLFGRHWHREQFDNYFLSGPSEEGKEVETQENLENRRGYQGVVVEPPPNSEQRRNRFLEPEVVEVVNRMLDNERLQQRRETNYIPSEWD